MTDWTQKVFGVNMAGYSQTWSQEMLSNRKAKSVGLYGETWAAAALERAGYVVTFQREKRRGDLLCIEPESGELIRVEVKTARRGRDGTFKFSLERQLATRLCTSAHHSDFVLLLAVSKHGTVYPYVLPVCDDLPQTITIPTHPDQYTGKYARFRQMGAIRLERASCGQG